MTEQQQEAIKAAYKTATDIDLLFDTGIFNDICMGYTAAFMAAAGFDTKDIKATLETADIVLDDMTASDARRQYNLTMKR